MVQFIKAYNKQGNTVFELSSIAISPHMAKGKASIALFGRFPAEVTGLVNVEAKPMGNGVMKEYRVMITVNPTKDLKHMLKIDKAVQYIEQIL